MNELLLSTGVIIVCYLWYFIHQRYNALPKGPRWLRGAVGTTEVVFAGYAVVQFAYETTITGWDSALINVAIVLLHLVIAILIAFMLWTMDRTYWLSLAIQRKQIDL